MTGTTSCSARTGTHPTSSCSPTPQPRSRTSSGSLARRACPSPRAVRHRPGRSVRAARRRHPHRVSRDGLDPRDRRRQSARDRAAGRDAPPARRGDGGARPRLPGLSGRGQREPRRQRRHQRRRHARGEVRGDAAPGSRARGGARYRRDHPHRRQVREVDLRLRPDPADRRLRGHARGGHRGHPSAVSATSRTRRLCSRPSAPSRTSPLRSRRSCRAASRRSSSSTST